MNKVSTTCKLSDDFTISYVLASHGVKCNEVRGIRDHLEPFNYGTDADALHKGSGSEVGKEDEDANMAKYHVCLADISGKRIRRRSRKR